MTIASETLAAEPCLRAVTPTRMTPDESWQSTRLIVCPLAGSAVSPRDAIVVWLWGAEYLSLALTLGWHALQVLFTTSLR